MPPPRRGRAGIDPAMIPGSCWSLSAMPTGTLKTKSTAVTRLTPRGARFKHLASVELELGAGQPHVPGDQDALDLAGPLADLEHLGIPIVPGHGELLDEPVAPVDLDG